jgi:hypothetical protein
MGSRQKGVLPKGNTIIMLFCWLHISQCTVLMMSEEDSQVPIWSYRVNLDKRIRSDHPLRQINGVLDLSFVRGQVAAL